MLCECVSCKHKEYVENVIFYVTNKCVHFWNQITSDKTSQSSVEPKHEYVFQYVIAIHFIKTLPYYLTLLHIK